MAVFATFVPPAEGEHSVMAKIRPYVWGAGWLLAVLVLALFALLPPETTIRLGPTPTRTHLGGANSYVFVSPDDLGPVDAATGLQRVPPNGNVVVNAFSYRPLTLHLDIAAGDAPIRVLVNDTSVGEIAAPDVDGPHVFRFVPVRNTLIPMLRVRFDTPKSFQLRGLSLDLAEQWQPATDAPPLWLTAICLLLVALLAGAVRLTRRSALGWLALVPTFGAVLTLVARAAAFAAVGPGGDMNVVQLWGTLGGCLYLVLFVAAFDLLALPLVDGQSLGRRGVAWAGRHPRIGAAISLTTLNAALTALVLGVVALQNASFDPLARFWDGPEYLVIAHSLYSPHDPLLAIPSFAQRSTIYWAAHFPFYPVALRLAAVLVGYIPALFLTNFVFTSLFAFALYRFLADFGYSRHPLWLACVSLFLPLRWLIYHSVGASEPATLLFLILCLDAFKRRHYVAAGLWGALLVTTRPNSIFVYAGLCLCLLWEAWQASETRGWRGAVAHLNWRAAVALTLMPMALLAVFGLFAWRYGDFLAYLHIPESVTHIYPVPLLSLDIGVGRSEGDFYYYLLEVAGLILLWRARWYDLFWVGLAVLLPTFFLLHDDVLRYSLPAFPLVLLIPFAPVLEGRAARWLALPTLLGVLIYSWSQLNTNMADPDTWRAMLPYLR